MLRNVIGLTVVVGVLFAGGIPRALSDAAANAGREHPTQSPQPQPPKPQPPKPQPSAESLKAIAPDTLVLVYPEQRISDAAQAQVAEFIAAVVPTDEWRSIERQSNESLRGLIDRVYDYYQDGPYARPQTATALAQAIVEKNASIAPGTTIKVPPMPVRGNGRFDEGESLRVYDTQSAGYAMKQEMSAFAAATEGAPDGQQTKVVDDVRAQRAASTTALTISADALRAALAERGNLPRLPSEVAILSARRNAAGESEDVGLSLIEFMTEPAAAPATAAAASCDAGSKWLDTSSYRQLALDRLTDGVKATLAAKAKTSPLVLFDFDFTGAGHGNKVRSVAEFALQSLGLSFDGAIKTVDFLVHDTAEKKALDETLTEFINSMAPGDNRRKFEPLARAWIENDSEHVIFGAYRIHDLVLQALFWKHLRGPSVANMSFRLQSPAMRVLAPGFLTAQPSAFAIIAAGNEAAMLAPVWVPQDTPLTVNNAINVTHGLLDGTILGTRSADGNPFRGVVSLLGPGCGFASVPMIASDSGSSLAAPYVAVAVWVKHLLDGETGPGLRRSLLRAVVPVPGAAEGIEAAGIFDPARLLATTGPHLRMRNGTIVPITDPLLMVQCEGAPSDVFQHFMPRDDEWQSVVLVKEDGKVRVWSREIPMKQALNVRVRRSCPLVALRFSAGTQKFSSLEEFEKAVSEIVM